MSRVYYSGLAPLISVFRRGLRLMLGLDSDVRMEVVYVVAMRFPVEVLMAKAIWRYFSRVRELAGGSDCPPVGLVVRWLR